MSILKKIKDHLIRIALGSKTVPKGLFELDQYFRIHGPIHFNYEKKDGVIVAISTDFRYGSVVTSGKNEEELDKNIKDAILTSFEVPSSYAYEAKIQKVSEKQKEYALA